MTSRRASRKVPGKFGVPILLALAPPDDDADEVLSMAVDFCRCLALDTAVDLERTHSGTRDAGTPTLLRERVFPIRMQAEDEFMSSNTRVTGIWNVPTFPSRAFGVDENCFCLVVPKAYVLPDIANLAEEDTRHTGSAWAIIVVIYLTDDCCQKTSKR